MLRYRSWRSFIPLPNVLGQRRQESFEHDLSPFLWWNFLRFSWPLNIFVHNTVFKSWNLGFPATAPVIFIGLLRLKKWSTEKKNTAGKIAKRRQNATDSKVSACSDIDLGEVLFHYVMFCDRKTGIFRARFIAFPSVEFPNICWTVRYICALLSTCW